MTINPEDRWALEPDDWTPPAAPYVSLLDQLAGRNPATEPLDTDHTPTRPTRAEAAADEQALSR